MDNSIIDLGQLCKQEGIELDGKALDRFDKYSQLLCEWNEKMNLTAIKDKHGIAIKHFYDSLLLLSVVDIKQGASVIDIGTGAGFPGVVLKIARPDIKLTLLDSLNKRLIFLKELLDQLGLEAELIHGRAEDFAKPPKREGYDIATARAVAALPVLSEYCLPYVKVGGKFVAMKGPMAEDELAASKGAIKLLGGKTVELVAKKLPEGDERNFVITEKISQTPTKYPRCSSKIAKSSL